MIEHQVADDEDGAVREAIEERVERGHVRRRGSAA
jgi:hypothetical protein